MALFASLERHVLLEFPELCHFFLFQRDQSQRVLYQRLLNMEVNWSIGPKTWKVVKLNDMRVQFPIQHHVYSQDLETVMLAVVFWKSRFVLMGQEGLARAKCLEDDVFDLGPCFVSIMSLSF